MEEKNLFNNINFYFKISVKINELNNSTCILNILNIKIKEYENKCLEFGFIKKNSIKIKKYSCGFLNPIIFVPFIEYKLLCSADVFHPQINDIYNVNIVSINKIGILCKLFYNCDNKKYIILNAIISKNNQDSNNLNNIKKNNNINIKIIGFKFNKYSKFISAICNIVSLKELEQTKKYSNIINSLSSIDIPFNFTTNKFKEYNNILKIILSKTNILEKEEFIYNFIINNKIEYNNKNYIQLYKNHITSYLNDLNEKKNEEQINIKSNTKYYQIKKKISNKHTNDDSSYSVYNDIDNDTEELENTSNNNDIIDIPDPNDEDLDDEEEGDEENENNACKINKKKLSNVINDDFEFDNQTIENSEILNIDEDDEEDDDEEDDDEEEDEEDEEDEEEECIENNKTKMKKKLLDINSIIKKILDN